MLRLKLDVILKLFVVFANWQWYIVTHQLGKIFENVVAAKMSSCNKFKLISKLCSCKLSATVLLQLKIKHAMSVSCMTEQWHGNSYKTTPKYKNFLETQKFTLNYGVTEL